MHLTVEDESRVGLREAGRDGRGARRSAARDKNDTEMGPAGEFAPTLPQRQRAPLAGCGVGRFRSSKGTLPGRAMAQPVGGAHAPPARQGQPCTSQGTGGQEGRAAVGHRRWLAAWCHHPPGQPVHTLMLRQLHAASTSPSCSAFVAAGPPTTHCPRPPHTAGHGPCPRTAQLSDRRPAALRLSQHTWAYGPVWPVAAAGRPSQRRRGREPATALGHGGRHGNRVRGSRGEQ